MLAWLVACTPEPDLAHRRESIQDLVRDLVGDLEAAGQYDCCIATPCNLCATRTAGCACGPGLRRGEPVCEECALMWAQGRGAEPGVDPTHVCSFLEAAHEREARSAGRDYGRVCGK